MTRRISVEISDSAFTRASARAKDIGHGTKLEEVAAEWIESGARGYVVRGTKFKDAARLVDRQFPMSKAQRDE